MGIKHLLVIMILTFFLALALVLGCGDDDDDDDTTDDDDDDETDDDDDDNADPTEVYNQCVEWYVDCVHVPDETAQALCGIITDAEIQGQCYVNAYAAWLECQISVVDCTDWAASKDEVEQCNQQLLEDVSEC